MLCRDFARKATTSANTEKATAQTAQTTACCLEAKVAVEDAVPYNLLQESGSGYLPTGNTEHGVPKATNPKYGLCLLHSDSAHYSAT